MSVLSAKPCSVLLKDSTRERQESGWTEAQRARNKRLPSRRLASLTRRAVYLPEFDRPPHRRNRRRARNRVRNSPRTPVSVRASTHDKTPAHNTLPQNLVGKWAHLDPLDLAGRMQRSACQAHIYAARACAPRQCLCHLYVPFAHIPQGTPAASSHDGIRARALRACTFLPHMVVTY